MYTGYFGKIKTYKKAGLIPVSICGKAPDWYTGHQYKKLAPKLGFFVEWSVGEHKLSVKAVASNGKEIELGNATVNIPNEDFVYNAFLNNIKIVMDYSVEDLTFFVYDNDNEVYSRKYPVLPMLVPQKQEAKEEVKEDESKKKEEE